MSQFGKQPSLVVLAAGMGSRYGGLKQIEPVGPSGETILDYSVHDAMTAGFGKVVFVIRRDIEDEFRRVVGARYESSVAVEYVFQETGTLPEPFQLPVGRTKPWGTGHAVWRREMRFKNHSASSTRMTSMGGTLMRNSLLS